MADTYQIAHFVGGPLNGRTYSILPNLDEWKVAVAPMLSFKDLEIELDTRVMYDVLTYRRILDTNIFVLTESKDGLQNF